MDNDENEELSIRNVVKDEVSNSLQVQRSNNNDIELGGLVQQINVLKGVRTALESPFETAIINHASEQFMTQLLPAMNAPPQARSFLDSGFAMSIGNRLPDVLPTLLDVGVTRLGKNNTDKIVGSVEQWLGGGNEQGNANITADEFINSLNADDPADIHKYMQLTGIVDHNEAKIDLVNKRAYLDSKNQEVQYAENLQKQQQSQQQSQQHQQQDNQTVNKALTENQDVLQKLVSTIQEDREVIKMLSDKITKLESDKDISDEKLNKIDSLMMNEFKDDADDVETVKTEDVETKEIETVNEVVKEVIDDKENKTVTKKFIRK